VKTGQTGCSVDTRQNMVDIHKLHQLDKSAVAEHSMETDRQTVSEH